MRLRGRDARATYADSGRRAGPLKGGDVRARAAAPAERGRGRGAVRGDASGDAGSRSESTHPRRSPASPPGALRSAARSSVAEYAQLLMICGLMRGPVAAPASCGMCADRRAPEPDPARTHGTLVCPLSSTTFSILARSNWRSRGGRWRSASCLPPSCQASRSPPVGCEPSTLSCARAPALACGMLTPIRCRRWPMAAPDGRFSRAFAHARTGGSRRSGSLSRRTAGFRNASSILASHTPRSR